MHAFATYLEHIYNFFPFGENHIYNLEKMVFDRYMERIV